MDDINRRKFLKHTALATLGIGVSAVKSKSVWGRPMGANDDITIAVVGTGNKGSGALKQLIEIKGVRIIALCDVDHRHLDKHREELSQKNISVRTYTDIRQLLENKDIDALVIATPNHWHTPITIWACQAGKDVYVEKPISHNVWEGRKLIEATRKYNRIVQCGTQLRSSDEFPVLIDYINEGSIGKIRWIHALRYKRRLSIGLVQPYYPDWLNYDLFCGPSPMVPLERKELHYDWHWMWDTGNGDLANLGIHVFDVARWIAGFDTFPERVISFGGRFVVNDAGQTPNTQLTLFDYPEIPIIMENRGLPANPEIEAMDHFRGVRNGLVVQCEYGYYAGYQGGWIFDNKGKKIKQIVLGGAENHLANFVQCVRDRQTEKLKAPVETGHISNASCLIGNISYRMGKDSTVEKIEENLQDFPLVLENLKRIKQHLITNKIDLRKTPLTLGPWLKIDEQQENISSVNDEKDKIILDRANFLLKDVYRPPYIIEENL
jgi:predicted dehydrogenase